jgi:hypothetical protein
MLFSKLMIGLKGWEWIAGLENHEHLQSRSFVGFKGSFDAYVSSNVGVEKP